MVVSQATSNTLFELLIHSSFVSSRNIYYYDCLELLVKNCVELRKLFMTSLK